MIDCRQINKLRRKIMVGFNNYDGGRMSEAREYDEDIRFANNEISKANNIIANQNKLIAKELKLIK